MLGLTEVPAVNRRPVDEIAGQTKHLLDHGKLYLTQGASSFGRWWG